MRRHIIVIGIICTFILCGCGKGEDTVSISQEEYDELVRQATEGSPDNEEFQEFVEEQEHIYETDSGSKEYPIDEKLLTCSLKDPYYQFGDMVFQGNLHMTLQEVKDVIDNSNSGITYKEAWNSDGGVTLKVNKGFHLKFMLSTEEHNYGEIGENYLACVDPLAVPTAPGYNSNSVYVGPFQNCGVDGGDGRFMGKDVLTHDALLEYLKSVGAKDISEKTYIDKLAEFQYGFSYNDKQSSTTVAASDYSFAEKYYDEDQYGNKKSLYFKHTYVFNWKPDGTLGTWKYYPRCGYYSDGVALYNEAGEYRGDE